MKRQLSNLEEEIATAIVHAAYKVHQELGPGLLEKIYEICMAHELRKAGYEVKRQVRIPVVYDGLQFEEGFRVDLLVHQLVIVEIKAVESINPVWYAQVISHLKITQLNLGFLINFNIPVIKKGIKRFIN